MEQHTPYEEAKAVLAAAFLIEFLERKAADISAIAALIKTTKEWVHHQVTKLEDLGAVRRITGPFEDKIAIVDESAIDDLEGKEHSANIEDEVTQFAEKQKSKFADIDSLFKGGEGEEKKDLKASLEEQLKAGGRIKKENPLDALSKKKEEPAE